MKKSGGQTPDLNPFGLPPGEGSAFELSAEDRLANEQISLPGETPHVTSRNREWIPLGPDKQLVLLISSYSDRIGLEKQLKTLGKLELILCGNTKDIEKDVLKNARNLFRQIVTDLLTAYCGSIYVVTLTVEFAQRAHAKGITFSRIKEYLAKCDRIFAKTYASRGVEEGRCTTEEMRTLLTLRSRTHPESPEVQNLVERVLQDEEDRNIKALQAVIKEFHLPLNEVNRRIFNRLSGKVNSRAATKKSSVGAPEGNSLVLHQKSFPVMGTYSEGYAKVPV